MDFGGAQDRGHILSRFYDARDVLLHGLAEGRRDTDQSVR